MFKLNSESKTGFPWSFFVGKKKKKIGPSSPTQTTENISVSTDTINPLPKDQASLTLACFVLRSSGILLSECFGFFLELLEFTEDRHHWESVEEKLDAIR